MHAAGQAWASLQHAVKPLPSKAFFYAICNLIDSVALVEPAASQQCKCIWLGSYGKSCKLQQPYIDNIKFELAKKLIIKCKYISSPGKLGTGVMLPSIALKAEDEKGARAHASIP